MKISFVLLALIISGHALATIECENTLIAHFKKIGINPRETLKSQDYLNKTAEKMGECIYKNKTATMEQLDSFLKKMDQFKVSDTRANEIVRVCSAITAFTFVGIDEKEIFSKILRFQNGWSESMREPLKEIIKSEAAAQKAKIDCNAVLSNDSGRDISVEKPEVNKTFQKDKKSSSVNKQ